ncbi:putative oxygen-independent coproporphyrinogen III oxidase [gamma proteobacterium HTCC5015]|nr:putative oxygen-independent coproporphyrinogen III oxidase [gamma proteobacterium HTCC5015]
MEKFILWHNPAVTDFSLPPLSLYVHLPWCVRKCPYCDFNSHERESLPEIEYIDALIRDLDWELSQADWTPRPLHSIFFGGGTPSLFSAEAIQRLLRAVEAKLGFEEDIEITLEANPGTAEAERFTGYRQAGVTRLSIGVQSFDDQQLQKLGRIHRSEQAVAAADMARAAGFTQYHNGAHGFNLDLMYALPGQRVEEALSDVEQALALEPSHISHYQLTLEPGTAFYYRPPELPDDDTAFAMQTACQKTLAEAGFEHYEVSAYSRPLRACRHNLNYWQFGDYLAIGAGSHAKLTSRQSIHRRSKVKTPDKYLRYAGAHEALDEAAGIPESQRGFEFMLNALRLVEGVPSALFEQRTGLPLATIEKTLGPLRERGLLTQNARRIQPTDQGLRFLNVLMGEFL